jgi:hypothetical protein
MVFVFGWFGCLVLAQKFEKRVACYLDRPTFSSNAWAFVSRCVSLFVSFSNFVAQRLSLTLFAFLNAFQWLGQERAQLIFE